MERSIQDVYKLRSIKQVPYKVNAMDEGMNCLYIGDTNGRISRHSLSRRESEFISEQPQTTRVLSGSKIECIKALPFGRDILVINNNQLLHLDGDSLATKQILINSAVTNLALNEANTHKNEVLVCLKNNKLVVLEFNINSYEFIQEKLTIPALPDTPLTIAFLGNLIYYGTKKEYGMIDLNKKLVPVQLSMNVSPYPYIKVTDNDELFILVTNTNTGILIGRDGMPKPSGTFDLLIKPVTQICVQKPYLIVMYDAYLQIFNMKDSKKMQETDFQGGAKRLVASQNTIIFSTLQKITLLEEIPFELRIKDCLKLCRIDEAMAIFYQSVSKDDQYFKEKEESMYLDASWNLIDSARFREAKNRLENREFDIREMLVLFKEYIPLTFQDKFTFNNNKNIAVTLGRVQDKSRIEGLEKEAYEMLVEVLEKRRNKYSNSPFKSQYAQKMTYNQSEYSPARQTKEITLGEIMALIDFALIKVFIRRNANAQLSELFKSNKPINCKAQFSEIFQLLREAQIDQKDPQIIAYFFEKFDRIKEALDKWRDIGMNLSTKYDQACNETIRILLYIDDNKRITEYLGWVIKKSVEYGKEFFKKVRESVISPEQMLAYISEGVYGKNDQGLTEKLIECYLEIIVNDKKISESRFHTKLASTYIDNLFKFVPRGVDPKEAMDKLSDIGQKLYKKFETFYQSPSSNYDASFLLEKVSKSWLIREEIYFYGKSKRHREALNLMISDLKEYRMAEEYCLQHGEKTLTMMFIIYMQYYNSICQHQKNQEATQYYSQLEDIRVDLETRISIFLKKYGTHSQLDALEVLKLIPDNWKLVEYSSAESNSAALSKAEDGLCSFLQQSISSSLHMRRQISVGKQLSEMDLQNVKCNLINTKKANVRITEDKKCAICHKSIGDKTVCIYPNGVVVDQKCLSSGQSLSICPQTLQDFEKTFRG